MKNILVVYFSRNGNNYVSGKIENIIEGNTKVMATYIQKQLEVEFFEIKAIHNYSNDYRTCTIEAKKEKESNQRPKLKKLLKSIKEYDVIYLGYPNWWGTMPMPVFTFLESYNFDNKIIIPFCTHEGSGFGSSLSDIRGLCPLTKVIFGKAVYGGNVVSSKKDIIEWLNSISYDV